VYNTLLTRDTELPVHTVVVLLRKEANSTDLTGVLTRTLPGIGDYLVWRYSVIRLWELPPAQFLSDPGLTPLAPLSAVSEAELSALAQQIQATWKGLTEPELKELKTATETLMGLRYPKEFVHLLFGEVSAMEESVIYQEILHIGQAKAVITARRTLFDVAKKRLGSPDTAQRKAIEQCDDLERLSRMTIAAVDAPNWASVLATE
jgi:predicted transposase YdaD